MTLHKNQTTQHDTITDVYTSTTPQTWIEISSSAFNHNVTYYKNKIGRHNNLAVVIKGNGYGHGLEQIASLCEQNEYIDWICVAQLSEALALHHITKPILVLGYSDVSPEYAIGKNIHFMVDHLEYAQELNDIGKKHSYRYNVHVKVDTGLSRMGVLADHLLLFMKELKQLSYLTVTGLYSHFAASDSNPEFTAQQLTQYNDVVHLLHAHTMLPAHIHMSNSASISTIAYSPHFNFFRVGIGMYGLGHDRTLLQPVMRWKTRIAHIKIVPTGSLISYAASHQVTRATRIALIPVGYYDGYKFGFSNKTSVLINGSYAPVLGRVAMNMTIVDVTDISAHKHDVVTLLGPEPCINAHDLARIGDIQNVREIITGINPTIVRSIIV